MINEITKEWDFDAQQAKNIIINNIKLWFKNNAPSGNAVIGISGGKDSTIVAALCVEALGKDRVIGVLMPNGVQKDIKDSIAICDYLGIKNFCINIEDSYYAIIKRMKDNEINVSNQTIYNLPPRLRMSTLFAIAQSCNGYVMNTSNLSEYFLGWFTFGSDTCGSFAPIMDYTCNEVIAIGKTLNIPDKLVFKTPSDGLMGITDEEKFGFSYADCDRYIRKKDHNVSPDVIEKIEKMHKKSEYKRRPISAS